MHEHSTHSVGSVTSPFEQTPEKNFTSPVAKRTLATHARPSKLVRQLSTPMVRLLDQIAILLSLGLNLFDAPMHPGQTIGSYVGARVSLANLLLAAAMLLSWRVLYWLTSLYQPNVNYRAMMLLWKVPFVSFLCGLIALPLLHLAAPAKSPFRSAALFWFFTCTLLLIVRAGVMTYEEQIRPALRKPRTAIICGTGPLARMQAADLAEHPNYRYQLLGFVDSQPHYGIELIGNVICGVQELEQLLMHQPIDEVIIGLPLKSHFGDVEQIVAICGRAGVPVQYSLDLFNTEVAKSRKVDAARTQQVVLEMVHHDQRLFVKSLVDRTLAAIGLVLLAPVFAVISLAIVLSDPGPIFFVQQRFGLNKRRFGMIKFRSMVIDAEARQAALEHMNENAGPTFKMKRDPRITRVGAFLRSTSMDELPQLINVLKGEMSLVGPRPLPTRDVSRFSEPWLMRRFSVKPGITGLWQVSGRSNTDFDNAIKLDLRYIDRWSLLMDVRILLQTVSAVIRRSGAY